MEFHVYSMIFPKALLNIAFVILADTLLEYLSDFDRGMKSWHVMRLESYKLSKTVPLTSVKSLTTYSPSLLRPLILLLSTLSSPFHNHYSLYL